MAQGLQSVAEWFEVSPEKFRSEIYPRGQPAILRGAVRHWPAVQAAKSPRALCDYIRRFDSGRPVGLLVAPPAIEGQFFYRDDMRGFNFARRKEGLGATLTELLTLMDAADPPATYIESALVADCVPGFSAENIFPLAGPSAVARIWVGNRLRTQTHYDLYDNIACVVAGRRRFTLFPPDQIENLYMGPFEFTLSGTPVSMVSPEQPDFERYPRFRQALETAQTGELAPGDAIYVPYFWWHHVQSLERFNALVSFWWNETPSRLGSLYNCLLHGVLAIRDLPENQRMAWRAVFDYFVFKTAGEPMEHLPPHARGALGSMTEEQRTTMKKVLLHGLQQIIPH